MPNLIHKYLDKFINKNNKNKSDFINIQQHSKSIKFKETKLQNGVTY
jgi:hypothetical protein